MDCATAHHGTAGVDSVPAVVGKGDKEVTAVFPAIAIAVTNKGTFVMVMKEDIADRNVVNSVSDVQEPVIVILISPV